MARPSKGGRAFFFTANNTTLWSSLRCGLGTSTSSKVRVLASLRVRYFHFEKGFFKGSCNFFLTTHYNTRERTFSEHFKQRTTTHDNTRRFKVLDNGCNTRTVPYTTNANYTFLFLTTHFLALTTLRVRYFHFHESFF